MRRIIGFFVVLALVGLGASWLANHSGHVVVSWDTFELETSVAFGLFAVAALIAVLLALSSAFARLVRAPGRLRARRAEDRRRRGLNALSRGMVAVAAGDQIGAERSAREASGLLDGEPLTLLLSAQAAQLAGNESGAEHHFAAMLANKETEFLGLRGLFVLANRRGDRALALNYLRRAAALRPGTPWVITALFDRHVADGRFAEAGEVLVAAQKAKLVDDQVMRRRRAVLRAAEARTLAAREPLRALDLAEEAVRLSPGLVPAAVLAGRILGQEGKVWKAQGIVEHAWTQSPHPDLARVYAELKPDETARARASRLMGLAQRNPQALESRLLTAQQWAHLRDYSQARAALGDLPSRFASARVAALMADIAQGSGAPGEARYWLDFAVTAPREPQWVCDNCKSPASDWQPVCAVCEGFDTLSWRAPSEQTVPGAALVTVETKGLPAASPVNKTMAAIAAAAIPAPTGKGEAAPTIVAPKQAAGSPPREKVPPTVTTKPPAAPARPASVTGKPAPSAPVGVTEAKKKAGGEGEPVIFISPRPPDDPGPAADKEEDVEAKPASHARW